MIEAKVAVTVRKWRPALSQKYVSHLRAAWNVFMVFLDEGLSYRKTSLRALWKKYRCLFWWEDINNLERWIDKRFWSSIDINNTRKPGCCRRIGVFTRRSHWNSSYPKHHCHNSEDFRLICRGFALILLGRRKLEWLWRIYEIRPANA